jgi:hypothetical protein
MSFSGALKGADGVRRGEFVRRRSMGRLESSSFVYA